LNSIAKLGQISRRFPTPSAHSHCSGLRVKRHTQQPWQQRPNLFLGLDLLDKFFQSSAPLELEVKLLIF
jgi:hypothetical protein